MFPGLPTRLEKDITKRYLTDNLKGDIGSKSWPSCPYDLELQLTSDCLARTAFAKAEDRRSTE